MRRFVATSLALSLVLQQPLPLFARQGRAVSRTAVTNTFRATPAFPSLNATFDRNSATRFQGHAVPSLEAPALETAPAALRQAEQAPAALQGLAQTLRPSKPSAAKGSREQRIRQLFEGSALSRASVFEGFARSLPIGLNRAAAKDKGETLETKAPADPGAKKNDAEDDEGALAPSIIFPGNEALKLRRSQTYGKINLVKNTPGSRWWWGRFRKGTAIDILLGAEKLKAFTTEVTFAKMIPIEKLTKEDLKGILPQALLLRNPIGKIRTSIRKDLAKRYKMDPRELPMSTRVKIVKFKPYSDVLEENEQRETIPNYDPYAKREPLKLSADNPLRRMEEFYPKTVIVDFDLFGDGQAIPPAILADMGKLQRSGVKFAFVSNTPGADHRLKMQQARDALYGSVFALDGGAEVIENRSSRQVFRENTFFTEYDQKELFAHAQTVAFDLGIKVESTTPKSKAFRPSGAPYFSGRLSMGADIETFKRQLSDRLKGFGKDFAISIHPGDGRSAPSFKIQRISSPETMPSVLRTLQGMGVYQNPQEVLVISEDQSIIDSIVPAHRALLAENGLDPEKATPGQNFPNPDVLKLTNGELKGAELADNVIGAILGAYRENKPDDFISSASAMTSFNSYKARFFQQDLQGFESNVYAHAGHMTHETMNWVAWMHRNGRLPSEEEALDRMEQMWIESHLSVEDQVYLGSKTLEGFIRAFRIRLANMYRHYVSIMMEPGVEFIGTEIPNIFMLTKIDKKTGEEKRYFVRAIFDMVAIKRRPDGTAQIMVVDFKSGIQPTMRKLTQDIQPNLYHLFAKYKWHTLPEGYQIVNGNEVKIGPRESSSEYIKITFIYSPNFLSPELDNWSQNRIETKARKLMDGMAKEKGRLNIRKPKRRVKADEKGKGKAPGRTNKKTPNNPAKSPRRGPRKR